MTDRSKVIFGNEISSRDYKKAVKSKKKYAKKFTVNSKTGKITVKKGVRKGSYGLTIEVRASGDEKYKPAGQNLTVTIKVK